MHALVTFVVFVALAVAFSLGLGPVTSADARQPTLQEKSDQAQRKERKDSERFSDVEEREKSLRVKLKKARQTRRTMTKNGEDTTDVDEDIEQLRRDSGVDDE